MDAHSRKRARTSGSTHSWLPELWSCWKYQINHLAEHGYHVVAPDMRGYGDSDSPQDPESYTIFHLVGDLIGLLDELGEEQVKGCSFDAQILHDRF